MSVGGISVVAGGGDGPSIGMAIFGGDVSGTVGSGLLVLVLGSMISVV